ncbi:MAG: SH3 domain-containing protein, partial [Anaerolineae bacterium]|nr:SH3 domain-containing protein [Anaerolineae bacterium]
DVTVRNIAQPDFPAWQSLVVETASETSACGAAPANAFVVQTPINPETSLVETSGIVINGTSLVLSGTVLVQTRESETLFVNLGGRSRVVARGQEQPLLTGEQISVPYAPGDFSIPAGSPSIAIPFDVALVSNLPVGLLDRPLQIPQPGYVSTGGQVNLRTAPNTDGALLWQVPAGEVMSVLGRNPAGDWLHVQLSNGLTGWMFADLLIQNLGSVQAVYEETPLPPQRYGALGTTARVVAPAGLNLREAPDVQFGLIVTLPVETQVNLLARSPYSPWVKVENGGVVGWAALIALETQAVINALPIDYDVPPPPAPTRVPGSFGNAFPDPRNNN